MARKFNTTSGNVLEQTVKTIFQQKGFIMVKYVDWLKKPDDYGDELLLVNVPFKTIYKHQGYTEFLLKSKKYNLTMRIECKWQQVSGSVDEKLPYLYLNSIEAMPEDHILIIIDGEGWKKGSIPWLKETVKEKKYTNKSNCCKKVTILNLREFITWANSYFR